MNFRACLLALAVTSPALAVDIEVTTVADFNSKLATVKPGDSLILKGGTYSFAGRLLLTLKGTAAQPITIRSKTGERAIITRADAAQNTIDMDGAEYLKLQGLEIKGGSACLAIGNSNFITLEENEIHECGDVAIAANRAGNMKGFVIRKNNIHHTHGTGEGMYLGANDGTSCTFNDGLIELNWVHELNTVGIEQGDGIEVKKNSTGNIVRDNVVHDTNYPCITTYSTLTGVNTFERNVLWKCGDHGIQATADVVIRNNIVLSAVSDGIRLQAGAAGSPKNAVIVNNTILKADGNAVRIDSTVGPVTLANNAIYGGALALDLRGGTVTAKNNVGIGSTQGAGAAAAFNATGSLANDFIMASMSGTVPNDVFPKAGGALVGKGDAALQPMDDFDGTSRAGSSDVGAYKFDPSGKPKWPLAASIKNIMNGAGPGDGGASSSGGSGGSGGAGSSSGGVGTSSGVAGTPAAGSDSSSGCGCRSVESDRSPCGVALFGIALLWHRRRARALSSR
jgi:MYXO-CTERM domain-containing protein